MNHFMVNKQNYERERGREREGEREGCLLELKIGMLHENQIQNTNALCKERHQSMLVVVVSSFLIFLNVCKSYTDLSRLVLNRDSIVVFVYDTD